MEYLTLVFTYTLPNYLLVKRSNINELNYKCHIDDFDIELTLIPHNWSEGRINENLVVYGIRSIKFMVTKQESIDPPPIPIKSDLRNLSARSLYFNQRLHSYLKLATVVLNRLIYFFKYQLHNPLLTELRLYGDELENVRWIDDTGKILQEGINTYIVQAIPGVSDKLGSRELMPDDDKILLNFLENPLKPKLYEELISDAQSAAFEGNLRRAVLELAISCEVIVKQTFFAKSTLAGEAFDFLEDKGKVKINTIELISQVAEQAANENFKKQYQKHYEDIDHLFRCRNKIAHKGELLFRDDKGHTHEVDWKLFNQWWYSVEILIQWLDELTKKF